MAKPTKAPPGKDNGLPEMATKAAIKRKIRGARMSLELASRWFDWSSIALAIGACIVFISTAAIVWLGIVKEHHWDVLREHANEKIASVGLQAARANAELGVAQADIAKAATETARANERTAELAQETEKLRAANLEMEKAFSPRTLSFTSEDHRSLKAFGAVNWAVTVVPTEEARGLWGQIAGLLKMADWQFFDGPLPAWSPMGGLTIYLRDDEARPAAEALAAILNRSGIETFVQRGGRWRLQDMPPGSMRLAIGAKYSLGMIRSIKQSMEDFEKGRREVLEEIFQRNPGMRERMYPQENTPPKE
jgi:hypothetical protein